MAVFRKCKPEYGDILYSRIGTIGEVRLIETKDKFVALHSIAVIKPNRLKIDNKYLFYLMKTNLIKSQAKKGTQSIGTPDLGLKQIEKFKIPLAPMSVQKQIVSILERAENLKQKRELANKDINKVIQSIFIDMFGDPIKNSKRFPQKKLGEVSLLTMGGTPDTKKSEYFENGTIDWMKSGDIKNDFIKEIPNKITKLGLENSNTKIYKKGEVVIALNGQGRTRATTGILKIDTCSNQSVACISPNKKELNSEYLHINLKLRYNQLRNLTGDKQRSGLNLTILRNLDMVIPPISLQNKFTSIVEKLEFLKESQKQSTQEINHLFEALMQKAFNGELVT